MSTRPAGSGESDFQLYRRGLSQQFKVIGALLMRELHTRYGRDNVGYLWMILEPLTLASAIALLHAGQATHYGTDIRAVPFAIIGYCVFIMFRAIFTRAEGALESNMPLLYHRMVTIFDIMTARALLEAAGTTATLAIMIGLANAIGVADPPARPLALLIGVAMMAWISFASSLLCLAATHDNKLATRFVHPGTYIMMPLSGAFYQVVWIPEPYRSYLMWFPLVQIFEQARFGMFESATNDYVYPVYICVSCMAMTFLGMIAIRVVRRHVHLH